MQRGRCRTACSLGPPAYIFTDAGRSLRPTPCRTAPQADLTFAQKLSTPPISQVVPGFVLFALSPLLAHLWCLGRAGSGAGWGPDPRIWARVRPPSLPVRHPPPPAILGALVTAGGLPWSGGDHGATWTPEASTGPAQAPHGKRHRGRTWGSPDLGVRGGGPGGPGQGGPGGPPIDSRSLPNPTNPNPQAQPHRTPPNYFHIFSRGISGT